MGSELTKEDLVAFSKKLESAFNDEKVGLTHMKGMVEKLHAELKSIRKLVKTLVNDASGAGLTAAVAAFDKAFKKHSWSNSKSKAFVAVKAESTQAAELLKTYLSDCVTHLKKFEKAATSGYAGLLKKDFAGPTDKELKSLDSHL